MFLPTAGCIASSEGKDHEPDREKNTEAPKSPAETGGGGNDRRAERCKRLTDIAGAIDAQSETLLAGRIPPAHKAHAD